jgi:hypothetical protein
MPKRISICQAGFRFEREPAFYFLPLLFLILFSILVLGFKLQYSQQLPNPAKPEPKKTK